jgi:hypothetical protein
VADVGQYNARFQSGNLQFAFDWAVKQELRAYLYARMYLMYDSKERRFSFLRGCYML